MTVESDIQFLIQLSQKELQIKESGRLLETAPSMISILDKEVEAMLQAKMDEYSDKFSNPYVAAARGLVDDVIEPADTRAYIALSLEILGSKREIRPEKKHGLIPL